MPKLKAVIFDLDGTLVDTFEYIYQAYEYAIRTHNYPARTRKEIASQVGRKLEDCYSYLVPKGDYEALMRTHRDFQFNNLALIRLYSGYHDLIQNIQELNLKVALFTMRKFKVIESLEVVGARSEDFDVIVSGDDVKKGKPDPEGVLLIAKKLKLSPKQTLIVGDADFDIQAGKNAGVAATIGLTHGFGTRKELEEAGADHIIDSLAELQPYLKGLLRGKN